MPAASARIDQDDDTDVKKPRKISRRMLWMLALLLIIGGGGGWAYFKGMLRLPTSDKQATTTKNKTSFLELPEITTNLANIPGQERPVYLRIKIALEVEDQKMIADIQPMMPRIVDNFQIYLRELRPSDLESSSKLYRLKEELIRRINVAVHPAKVEAVLFKEILVQ